MPEIQKAFSDNFIASVNPKKALQIFVDKYNPNLKLYVRPSGVKNFYVRAKVNGKDIKRKLGDSKTTSLALARILAESFVNNRRKELGTSCQEAMNMNRVQITVDQIFELYKANELVHRCTIAGRTHSIEVAYNRHIKSSLGQELINNITKKSARAFFKELEGKGYGVHNKCLSALKAAVNYVIDYEEDLGITVNPFERLKKMAGVTRSRYLTHEEASNLLKALDDVDNQDVADIFRVALFTGARLSNVKQMKWHDLNLNSSIWLIPASRTKTRQHYEIPLHSMVVDLLKNRYRHSEGSEYVFASSRSQYGYITGGDPVWKAAIKAAGLYHDNPNIRPRPHDLRRTFATWQIQSGADISVVSKALCHTSLKHTTIYAHTNVSQVRDAIDGAFRFLE